MDNNLVYAREVDARHLLRVLEDIRSLHGVIFVMDLKVIVRSPYTDRDKTIGWETIDDFKIEKNSAGAWVVAWKAPKVLHIYKGEIVEVCRNCGEEIYVPEWHPTQGTTGKAYRHKGSGKVECQTTYAEPKEENDGESSG